MTDEFDISKVATDDQDFDVRKALSGRDKKIADQQQEIEELKASLHSIPSELESKFDSKISDMEALLKTQSEENARLLRIKEDEALQLGDEDINDDDLTVTGAEKISKRVFRDASKDLRDQIDALHKSDSVLSDDLLKRFDSLQEKVEAVAQNSFRSSLGIDSRINDPEFIEWAKDTDFDLIGTKVITKLAESEEGADHGVVRTIFDRYDKHKREGSEPNVTTTVKSISPDLTPEKKKVVAKIESLRTERDRLARTQGVNEKVREITDEISQLMSQAA